MLCFPRFMISHMYSTNQFPANFHSALRDEVCSLNLLSRHYLFSLSSSHTHPTCNSIFDLLFVLFVYLSIHYQTPTLLATSISITDEMRGLSEPVHLHSPYLSDSSIEAQAPTAALLRRLCFSTARNPKSQATCTVSQTKYLRQVLGK